MTPRSPVYDQKTGTWKEKSLIYNLDSHLIVIYIKSFHHAGSRFPKTFDTIAHFLEQMILGTSLQMKNNYFDIIIRCKTKQNNKANFFYSFPFNKYCTLFNYPQVKI